MKKILISLMAILLAGGLVGAGALAYFSDVETSEDNIFTAGTLDLQVVSPYGGESYPGFPPEKTYNGVVIPGNTVSDVKPGDSPIMEWRMHVNNLGSLDGVLFIHFVVTANNENTLEEPEQDLGDTGEPGELGANLVVDVYYGDESQWPSLPPITSDTLDELDCDKVELGALTGEQNPASKDGKDVFLVFRLPPETNSICQTDSVTFDIKLILEQEK